MNIPNLNPANNPRVLRLVIKLRTLVKIGIVLFLAFLVGIIFMVRTTEKPEFCSSCHIMKPYYEAWKTSTHNHVTCIECHYAPGIVSTFEGKFKAISQVAKYVTATAGTRPWAEIPDESCLREGCHERRLLKSEVKFGNVMFDHRPHLIGMRRGKQLRCTSCHSQVVMGNHLSVTESTCFICHFKDKTFAEKWESCLKCHPAPKSKIEVEGEMFEHSEFIGRKIPCMKCHIEVVEGNGEVPRERCHSCHSEETHTSKYDNSSLIHKKHVTEHKVECFDCHLEIRHGLFKTRKTAMPSCDTCHIGTHKAQFEMFYGEGGRLVKPHKSEMAAHQVDCRACHIVNPNKKDSEFTGTTLETKGAACMACHGVEYKDILDNWQRAMDIMLKDVEALLRKAEAAKAHWRLDKDDRVIANELFKDALYNYRFVLNGKGAHNIHYSRELLKKSQEIFKALINPKPEFLESLVNTETKEEHLPPDVNCTKLCHVVAPDRDIVFFDKTFPHSKHGPQMGVACTVCHSTEEHGKTLLTIESCSECHHSDKGATGCRNCHEKSAPTLIGDKFPHRKHFSEYNLSCVTCHELSGNGRLTLARDCKSCHHGDKKAECDNCHSDKVEKISNSKMDYDCTICHKPTEIGLEKASNVCAKCHRQQIDDDKHAKKGCGICHFNHTWNFKGVGVCADCHKAYKHTKDAGADCLKCHTPHAWMRH